jgi:hypothetical protein
MRRAQWHRVRRFKCGASAMCCNNLRRRSRTKTLVETTSRADSPDSRFLGEVDVRPYVGVWVVLCGALGGCPRSSEQSSTQQAVGSGSAACDMTPIAIDGMSLPACAAGTSGSTGPGTPFDHDKEAVPSYVLSVPEIAAKAAADALTAARNPAGHSPVDRGFAPPPSSGSGGAK